MPEGSNQARKRTGSAALAETKDLPLDRVTGTPISIDGETAIVGKLGINQITALAREVLAAAIRMTPEERARLVSAGQLSDVAVLLMVLDAKTVNRIFSIVLDKEEEWCGAHVGALETLEIADAVLEHNKWEQIQAVFLRLRKRFGQFPKTSAPLSPPSPASDSPSATSASIPSNGSSESPERSESNSA